MNLGIECMISNWTTWPLFIMIVVLVIFQVQKNWHFGKIVAKVYGVFKFKEMIMQTNIRLVNSMIIIIRNCAKSRDPTSKIITKFKFILLINTIDNILNSGIIFDNTVNIAIKIEISMVILLAHPVVCGINTIMFFLCVFDAIYGIGLILYTRLNKTFFIFTFEKTKRNNKKIKKTCCFSHCILCFVFYIVNVHVLFIVIKFIETNKTELKVLVEHILSKSLKKKMHRSCRFIFARICIF